jgi:4-hydroxybenzoate polyprenyltransferase
MLFLFQGRYRTAARAILGAVLLAAGLALPQIVLAVLGGLLIVWAAASALNDLRVRRQDRQDRQHRRDRAEGRPRDGDR